MDFFVDVIVETAPGELLLIERNSQPAGWAFPGGVIDEGEAPEVAAVREVREETGLEVKVEEMFHVYPFYAWSGMMTGVTYVYRATVVGGTFKPGDDAKAVNSFPFSLIPTLISAHEEILNHYLHLRQHGERPEPGSWLLGVERYALVPHKSAA
ncbi:MAG: NUDIX hydrolase [Bdellovibrionota bacterium]